MAQFTLNWDNSDVNTGTNNQNQVASYRRKSVGGTWITTGFTPSNNLPKTAITSLSPDLLVNVIYEFKVDCLCTQNGPSSNDNGVIEQIHFSCLTPVIVNNSKTSTITLDVTGLDITKARFTLKKSSDNSIKYGPTTVDRIGNSIQAVGSGLSASTSYYWEVTLFANVNGAEVNSLASSYIGAVCGPHSFTTDAGPALDLRWIANTKVCEKEGGFGVVKVINGLSSPSKTWYDSTTNRVYVADHDDPVGNVYWFNPDTATTAADMVHSSVIIDPNLYNAYIDGPKRKIYFVGANSNGLIVYDIDTNTKTTVAFGSNAPFSRILLTVTENFIYCNNSTTSIVIIDRNTLTVSSTKLISAITIPDHFTVDVQLVQAGTKLYAINNNNAAIGTIGVYSLDLNTHIGEITLPGAATWAGGFGNYWQVAFYDQTSNKLLVSDIGSNKRHVIDASSDTVVDTQSIINRESKSNAILSWVVDPVTNNLLALYSGVNSSADGTPIKRVYIENRTTHAYTQMFEGQSYSGVSHITGTDKIIGNDPGGVSWNSDPDYNTDGLITILSSSTGTTNTGKQIVVTLKEVDHANSDLPTGNTKSNLVSDPNYIAPTTNYTDCPVVNSLTCPVDLVSTFISTTLDYEFSIIESVRKNTTIAKIQVYAYNIDTSSTEGSPIEITGPLTGYYYKGQFTSLGGSNYTIKIKYLDSLNNVLQTC